MASTIVFLLVRRVLGLVGLGPKPDDKDVEIAVLRHQLAVLHRQVARPRYAPTDRLVLATLARLLPRERWASFLVTPATLLRWHRELVRRRWTYAHEPCVRRGLDPAVVELVLRLARENPRWVTCRSVASAPSSGRRCRPPRCATSSADMAWDPPRGGAARVGPSSFAPRPPGSWRVTSSRSRRSD